LKNEYVTTPIHIDISLVNGNRVDLEKLKLWRADFGTAEFITDGDTFTCAREAEKMSKRWHNVVNPDDVVAQYGADTLRMYEMFMGPIEQHKPWNTDGLSGVFNFLKKLWRLVSESALNEGDASAQELKALHTAIKKVTNDLENYSFNTCVSAFMICVNDLQSLKCKNKGVLEQLTILLSPFAPFTAEEMWSYMGNAFSVTQQPWPTFNDEYLKEDLKKYPVSFNGKVRYQIEVAADAGAKTVEAVALENPLFAKYTEGKEVKKIIVVPGRIVNIVI
jgi:leucyl-tRNA synthetase